MTKPTKTKWKVWVVLNGNNALQIVELYKQDALKVCKYDKDFKVRNAELVLI